MYRIIGLLPQMNNCIKKCTSCCVHVHSRYYAQPNQLLILTLYHITNTMGMIIKYLLAGFFRDGVTWMLCYVLNSRLQFENQ